MVEVVVAGVLVWPNWKDGEGDIAAVGWVELENGDATDAIADIAGVVLVDVLKMLDENVLFCVAGVPLLAPAMVVLPNIITFGVVLGGAGGG